jgi:hypothetical protein
LKIGSTQNETTSKIRNKRCQEQIKQLTTREGARFRSKITGNVYEVKKIVDSMVVLGSLDGTSQVLRELDNMALFYEREPMKDEDQG